MSIEGLDLKEQKAIHAMYSHRDTLKWNKIKRNRGKKSEGMDHTNLTDKDELKKRLKKYEKVSEYELDEKKVEKASVKKLALSLLSLRRHVQFPLDY